MNIVLSPTTTNPRLSRFQPAADPMAARSAVLSGSSAFASYTVPVKPMGEGGYTKGGRAIAAYRSFADFQEKELLSQIMGFDVKV